MNKYIDHTILKATATKNDIKKICEEAIKYDFKSVCINPYYVSYAKSLLEGSDVLVCTVIGFPLGANSSKTKGFETKTAIEDGADEIDMVINIGALLDAEYDVVLNDIKEVVNNASSKTVKVIIETCYLNDEQKKKACELSLEAKASFVKTSTGFGTGGATEDDVSLMKSVVKDVLEVKASGGVRNMDDCQKMIDAGATRIGTSNGIEIVTFKEVKNDY